MFDWLMSVFRKRPAELDAVPDAQERRQKAQFSEWAEAKKAAERVQRNAALVQEDQSYRRAIRR